MTLQLNGQSGGSPIGALINDSSIKAEWYEVTPESAATPLPFMVDNSQLPYFSEIVDQGPNYSCAQAATIGYMFSYEANRFRNEFVEHDSDYVHMYPPGFTFNLLNEGDPFTPTAMNSGLKILTNIGVPRCSDYENTHYLRKIDDPEEWDYKRWITGYDFYMKAMENKPVLDVYKIQKSSDTTMIWEMKHWLNDHNAGDTTGGVFYFSSNLEWGNNILGELPPESYDANGTYIVRFTDSGGHAMTVVGYNDKCMG